MDVKIFKPSKSAMQSGHGYDHGAWVIEYESSAAREPEPLMGWTSAGDTLNQVRLKFSTQNDAIAFAAKNGWTYTVLPDRSRRIKPRNYVDNFKYVPPQKTG